MVATTVSVSRCENYDTELVSRGLNDVLARLGGIEEFVAPGDLVLLKVNLLRSAAPGRAVTTHPAVLEAVINAVRSAGGTPVVGDSPGGPNTESMLKKIVNTTELAEVCSQTGTELIIFDRDTTNINRPEGKLYTRFTVGTAVRDADVIIGIPKLKTHGFQKLTGAVKLFFGVIPGLEKAQYHLKVPNRLDFADMLLDVYLAVKPRLTIMDAVEAMEGDGPSGGSPRHVGALLAGTDAVAVDIVAAKILGFDPLDIYTNRAAVYRGLITALDDIVITGPSLTELLVNDFKPATSDMADKIPGRLVAFLRDFLVSKPYLAAPGSCSGCDTCGASCPSNAIRIHNHVPQFDYAACIRCYCCEELCPELAIKRKNHWLLSPFLHGGR